MIKFLIGAGIVVAVFGGGVAVVKMSSKISRGYRNNNAGNIDLNAIKWDGMRNVQDDGRFVQFVAPEYGIRALTRVMLSYRNRHKLVTVRGIINRYAPPGENVTSAYVSGVASDMGVAPDDIINVNDGVTMRRLVTAIIKHENGFVFYSPTLVAKGVAMGGVV